MSRWANTVKAFELSLSTETRKRVLWVSVVPLLVLAMHMLHYGIEANYDIRGYYYGGVLLNGAEEPIPNSWRHLYNFTGTAATPLLVFAAPLLFLFGVERVTRQEGSWYLLIAAGLALVGLAMSLVPPILYLVYEPVNPSLEDWRTDIFFTLGTSAGSLALGYAFLAYRGLSRQQIGRRVYGQRRRRYPQPDVE
jgi:hypothetical protein